MRHLALLLPFLATASSCGSDEPREPHSQYDAWVMCETFIEQRLVAPSTVKYPAGTSQYTTDLGGGRYYVSAYVDAQNGFGAMVRMPFECTVRWLWDDRWELEEITLAGVTDRRPASP
jgi:hypothetical protein